MKVTRELTEQEINELTDGTHDALFDLISGYAGHGFQGLHEDHYEAYNSMRKLVAEVIKKIVQSPKSYDDKTGYDIRDRNERMAEAELMDNILTSATLRKITEQDN